MKRIPLYRLSPVFFMLAWALSVVLLSSCKTKAELRREQDVERMKQDLTSVKSDRADIENMSEELKGEIARLSNLIEDRAVKNNQQIEEVRKEMAAISQRVANIEGHAAATEDAERQAEKARVVEKARATYELGKRYYDDGKYDEASETFKTVARQKDKPEDAKKALYWLGESYYSSKEYASAAIQFAEYKKLFPKDNLVPQSIYRQANAFRSMNKPKEAKLFYQELLDKYPKHALAKKAKAESKKLK